MLDINQIKDLIPHRFPFLLVDRIIELDPGKRVVGIKNITVNDFYCQQDFPGKDLGFSGALQVEAMAQVAGFIVMGLVEDKNKLPLLASIEGARFRKVAKPGDQLRIEATLKRYKAGMGKFEVVSYINDEIASEATIGCMIGALV
jgi:3-hydroxyacyl-[acyl-carrier-protein] dehydratase